MPQSSESSEGTRNFRKYILLILALLVAALAAYFWDGSGFNTFTSVTTTVNIPNTDATRTEEVHEPKRLWDWMDLLIVPLALATVAIWFNSVEQRRAEMSTQLRESNAQRIADEQRRDASLEAYFDRMSSLISPDESRAEGRTNSSQLARTRTLTTLERLSIDLDREKPDGKRKAILLRFLYETQSLSPDLETLFVSLAEADLTGVDLHGANFSGINLSGANLSNADLTDANLANANLENATLAHATLLRSKLDGAKLSKADLSHTCLKFAVLAQSDMSEAVLEETDLDHANLEGCKLRQIQSTKGISLGYANLEGADLTGTIIPDKELKKARRSNIIRNGESYIVGER